MTCGRTPLPTMHCAEVKRMFIFRMNSEEWASNDSRSERWIENTGHTQHNTPTHHCIVCKLSLFLSPSGQCGMTACALIYDWRFITQPNELELSSLTVPLFLLHFKRLDYTESHIWLKSIDMVVIELAAINNSLLF